MKIFTTKIVFILILLLFVNSTIHAQNDFNLQYCMPKSKTYVYKYNQTAYIVQNHMLKKNRLKDIVHRITSMKIADIDKNGNMNLFVNCDTATQLLILPNNEIEKSNISNQIDEKTQFVISKYGNILSRKRLDSLSHKSRAFKVTNTFGDNLYLIKLPNKSIKLGDTWKDSKIDTITFKSGKLNEETHTGITKANYIYKLENVVDKNNKSCYKITYSASVSFTENLKIQGRVIITKANGKVTGNIYMSAKDGSIISKEWKGKFDTIAMTSNNSQKSIMPSSVNGTIKLISK